MNLNSLPWPLILFCAGQVIAFVLWSIKQGNRTEANEKEIHAIKSSIDELKKENADLKKELREIRDILIQVKSATDLLMLGRIKTGSKDAA